METALARFGWLAHCSAGFRGFVLANLVEFDVKPGRQLTHAGDPTGGLFAVAEGQGVFHAALGASSVAVSSFLFPGSWWGQGPLVGLARIGLVTALTECRIATLPLGVLRQRLAEHPGDWEAIAQSYSDLFVQVTGAQRDLLIPGHGRRLAATLLRLGDNRHRRFAVAVPDSFVCTQEDLASAVGLARNATGRLVRRLEADGLVEARYGRLRMRARERLRQLADAE